MVFSGLQERKNRYVKTQAAQSYFQIEGGVRGAEGRTDGIGTLHHTGRFCAATNEVSGWITDMRELVGDIDADLVDIRGGGFDGLLAPDDYASSQAFARTTRDAGDNGIVYPSVRHKGGECFATFLPNVMGIPIQGRHITYHWDGNHIDMIQDVSDDNKVYEIEM